MAEEQEIIGSERRAGSNASHTCSRLMDEKHENADASRGKQTTLSGEPASDQNSITDRLINPKNPAGEITLDGTTLLFLFLFLFLPEIIFGPFHAHVQSTGRGWLTKRPEQTEQTPAASFSLYLLFFLLDSMLCRHMSDFTALNKHRIQQRKH